jgi:hypothetical protein
VINEIPLFAFLLHISHFFSGVAFLRECAAGTIFDIIQRKCDDEELATCISGMRFVE